MLIHKTTTFLLRIVLGEKSIVFLFVFCWVLPKLQPDSRLKSELSEAVNCIEKSDRTIVNPEPLLALPKKLYVNTRGPSGAAVYLRYTWRFFAKLPGARDIIADFLYPNHTEGMYISLVLVQYGFSSLLWHDFSYTYFIAKMNKYPQRRIRPS